MCGWNMKYLLQRSEVFEGIVNTPEIGHEIIYHHIIQAGTGHLFAPPFTLFKEDVMEKNIITRLREFDRVSPNSYRFPRERPRRFFRERPK